MRNFLKKRLLVLESKSDPTPPVAIVMIEVSDRMEAAAALAWCDGSSYPLPSGEELPSTIRFSESARYWPEEFAKFINLKSAQAHLSNASNH